MVLPSELFDEAVVRQAQTHENATRVVKAITGYVGRPSCIISVAC